MNVSGQPDPPKQADTLFCVLCSLVVNIQHCPKHCSIFPYPVSRWEIELGQRRIQEL